jgi:hypothetical protein
MSRRSVSIRLTALLLLGLLAATTVNHFAPRPDRDPIVFHPDTVGIAPSDVSIAASYVTRLDNSLWFMEVPGEFPSADRPGSPGKCGQMADWTRQHGGIDMVMSSIQINFRVRSASADSPIVVRLIAVRAKVSRQSPPFEGTVVSCFPKAYDLDRPFDRAPGPEVAGTPDDPDRIWMDLDDPSAPATWNGFKGPPLSPPHLTNGKDPIVLQASTSHCYCEWRLDIDYRLGRETQTRSAVLGDSHGLPFRTDAGFHGMGYSPSHQLSWCAGLHPPRFVTPHTEKPCP